MIPNHAQKCSYPQIVALTDEKTCICDCVYMKNALYAVLRPFAVSRYVMTPKDT